MSDFSEETQEFVAMLHAVFNKLDRNHDGVLQLSEIDRGVMDPELDPQFAPAVAILKAGFTDIRDLHKAGWFARKHGITRAALRVFEQLLLLESAAEYSTCQRQLVELTNSMRRRVADAARMKRALYQNMRTPMRNIRPEAIRQGIVGDCAFLAALGAVAATNPHLILRSIRQDEAQVYTVTFPGARDEPYTVQAPGLVELSLYAQVTRWGIWPAVLEKAYGQYLMAHGDKQTVIPTDATAAHHVYDAMDVLTGQMGRWQFLSVWSDAEVRQALTAAVREKRAMVAATFPSAEGDSGFTLDGMPAHHAYSILAWNVLPGRVTLRNPWGPQVHSERGTRARVWGQQSDGVCRLTLSALRRNFITIYYEEWLPDERSD